MAAQRNCARACIGVGFDVRRRTTVVPCFALEVLSMYRPAGSIKELSSGTDLRKKRAQEERLLPLCPGSEETRCHFCPTHP